MGDKKRTGLVVSALFAALCCVATMVIRIPTVGTNGYINIGDTIVLLSAWMIGGAYGALAAGIGSALADILASYVTYAPGTFLIKFLMALTAYGVVKAFRKVRFPKIAAYLIAALAAECIMVAGYFLYESTVLGYGMGALPSVASNAVQGSVCLVLAIAAIELLDRGGVTKKLKERIGRDA